MKKVCKIVDVIKKNKILTSIIISIILCIIAMKTNYNKLNLLTGSKGESIQFNLLTVNSIIAGFIFTNLGLLISISQHEVIQKLRCTTIIERKNSRMMTGLVFHIIVIFIALSFIFDVPKCFILIDKVLKVLKINIIISTFLIDLLAIFEIVCLVIGILHFTLSIRDIHSLLQAVTKRNDNVPDEEIDKYIEKRNSLKDNQV